MWLHGCKAGGVLGQGERRETRETRQRTRLKKRRSRTELRRRDTTVVIMTAICTAAAAAGCVCLSLLSCFSQGSKLPAAMPTAIGGHARTAAAAPNIQKRSKRDPSRRGMGSAAGLDDDIVARQHLFRPRASDPQSFPIHCNMASSAALPRLNSIGSGPSFLTARVGTTTTTTDGQNAQDRRQRDQGRRKRLCLRDHIDSSCRLPCAKGKRLVCWPVGVRLYLLLCLASGVSKPLCPTCRRSSSVVGPPENKPLRGGEREEEEADN